MSPERVAIPELGVAPLVDPDNDLEDDLPTPEDSMLLSDSSPEGVRLLGVCPVPLDIADLELEKALLSVSVLPVMVTPIVDPVVVSSVAPSLYQKPPLPVLPDNDPGATSRISPLRVTADSLILDVFLSYLISPACSVYEPVTSPITPSSRDDDDYRPPTSPATMDQYLLGEGDLLLGDTANLPLLVMPLTPHPIVDDLVPDDVHQDALESGATPQVLDSLPGCQYRMTSYDDDVDRSDLNPAYGIHLHDPRLLEYVGAPESARLLSRTPEYWIHHMGRDRTMSAALQLQHDAGLILSNLQVLGQFVTSLNRISSEVKRVAFAHEPFPTEAVQSVAPSHGV